MKKRKSIYQELISFGWKKGNGKFTNPKHNNHYFTEKGFYGTHHFKDTIITEIHKNDLQSYLKILG